MQENTNPKLLFEVAKIGVGGIQLGELLIKNGHQNSRITYLKVDIESAELEALPVWIKSGALNNAMQLGLELHGVDRYPSEFWSILQDLYHLGFRVISYDPNFCSSYATRGLYQSFEIVFINADDY
ncbi:uncharacterized protein LOC131882289 [Tigriopus californicus]|uniref:uncharacterized protein LOC131882289 n=1 Tax=Tigriopus californicus TaxID=6832 RepID=UPI0027D9D037|nr:uncharacterized protein LOC131882289 [Tigriopus californicus]